MKKLRMITMCLLAMMSTSLSVKAQEVTITLMPGWTWISVPITEVQDFETTLGSFTPQTGDIIKSQWGNASYVNGQWRGNISQFFPGYGYMYKSNRTMPVFLTFTAQQPAPQVIVTTAEPTDITTNSAICGGNVASSDGNYVFVILRGICWSTNPNPTFNDNYIEAGNGLGSFTASMTDLAIGTTYYVRAFAVTASGTFYGNEVSFTPDHTYVDLGLPSGVLWATCNVGAENPEDYGGYFAWGETQPKDYYDWSTYQYCNSNKFTMTKYCNKSNFGYNGFTDNLTILLPEDDAATVEWDAGWRTPTRGEWQELRNNTTGIWTTQNGVNGWLLTASNGNSLFLPAAGNRYESNFGNVGCGGGYWSSSLSTDYPNAAWCFYFYSDDDYGWSSYYRCYGITVRPVRSVSQK